MTQGGDAVLEAGLTTLTFLFTDLEGSTALWERFPDEMRSALARHDEILHAAVVAHGGHVVKSTGDGTFATFRAAPEGVGAAVAAQQGLAAAEWPDVLTLRVRMGLHLGHATERAGDWYGPDVNRAARVAAVAHGGQVVCTGVVEDLVREQFDLLDLGEHRLRDLQSSVHLFQVEVPGVPGDHPSLRSLDAYLSNLPFESSSFIGREHEVRSVAALVSESRVVSIVGVGGVGKTRLALQVGSELLPEFADGVWICELAAVLEPDDLHDAVAAAVGYTPPAGVTVVEGLPRFLERKELLLILDNCEHLVGAVASFVDVTMKQAAGVSLLATSREALGVRGEHVAPLASLTLPERPDPVSVLASEAGTLFVARAREARGELVVDDTSAPAVYALCERLDGIALAIELAAAQTVMMSPVEINERLDRQFRLLTGGRRTALERHQTLRAAIDWSYDLLGSDEQALLDRLSVCVGGFDLDAAESIGAGIGTREVESFELLGALVAKSLVERNERAGTTRYRLLEMIRQYAGERLNATGTSGDARDAHARHYLDTTGALFRALRETDDNAIDRLEVESANIAAAGRWLLATERLPELLLFFRDLPFVDHFALPAQTLEELATIAAEATHRPDASALPGYPSACYVESLRAFIEGDAARYAVLAALARADSSDERLVENLVVDSTMALFDGDLAHAASAAGRAVDHARREGGAVRLVWVLAHHAVLVAVARDPATAAQALADAEEALGMARRIGGSVIMLYPLAAMTNAARVVDPPRALDAADELDRIDQTRRRWWSSIGRGVAAMIRVELGDLVQGLTDWKAIIRSSHENGERFVLSSQIASLADVMADIDELLGIELAAIAESGAIARIVTFSVQPGLVGLAAERESAFDAARTRAASMSYDEAIAFVFSAIDQAIALLTAQDRGARRG